MHSSIPQSNSYLDQKRLENRYKASMMALMLVFVILAGRLFHLQIVKGDNYRQQAGDTSTFVAFPSNPPRGLIFDRDGHVLASNKQYISLFVIPSILAKHNSQKQKTIRFLSHVLRKRYARLNADIAEMDIDDSRPILLQKDLSIEQAALIYENGVNLPGVIVQHQSARHYPEKDSLAHVIGYTGQITESQLVKYPKRRLNDIIGKMGLEQSYDMQLRGQSREHRIKVNRYGQPIQKIDFEQLSAGHEYQSGHDLRLTIDRDLQQAAYQALEGHKGSVVAVNPNNGEVLAMVSRPSFNPNFFTRIISERDWKEIKKNNLFLNRSISRYPPGSIWKPTSLFAALEENVVKPTDKFYASGAYYMNGYKFGDWTDKREWMDIKTALAWSRDTVFYQMADYHREKKGKKFLSVEMMNNWGQRLGIGQETGLEISGESSGLLPDKKWQKQNLYYGWLPGNTLHYSIGQGYLLMTPAQAARMASFYATGILPRLHLLKSIAEKEVYAESELTKKINYKKENLEIIRSAMKQCVDTGTCQAARLFSLSAAGKTGSAETHGHKKTHAWYISYAPVENPEIAIAVFSENSGHGGSIAAPIAKKVLKSYFAKHHEGFSEEEKKKESEFWQAWWVRQQRIKAAQEAKEQARIVRENAARRQEMAHPNTSAQIQEEET